MTTYDTQALLELEHFASTPNPDTGRYPSDEECDAFERGFAEVESNQDDVEVDELTRAFKSALERDRT